MLKVAWVDSLQRGSHYTVHECLQAVLLMRVGVVTSEVFYGQEPPSGESTTTACGVNYQPLAVITEVAPWGTPSCSRPQPATHNWVRDGRSN